MFVILERIANGTHIYMYVTYQALLYSTEV